MNKKPPLGLIPKNIWFEDIQDKHAQERIQEVKEAMLRYMCDNMAIPEDWYDEYNELVWRVERNKIQEQKFSEENKND